LGDDHLDVDVSLRQARAKVERPDGGAARTKPSGSEAHRLRKRREALIAERDRIETEVTVAEARIAEIDAAFAAPGYWDETSRDEARALEEERARLTAEVERQTQRWAEVEEEIAREG
jgi:hypothetical protein